MGFWTSFTRKNPGVWTLLKGVLTMSRCGKELLLLFRVVATECLYYNQSHSDVDLPQAENNYGTL